MNCCNGNHQLFVSTISWRDGKDHVDSTNDEISGDPSSSGNNSNSNDKSGDGATTREQLIQEAIQVLETYQSAGDPLMILQMYYQKQGLTASIAEYFLPPQCHRLSLPKLNPPSTSTVNDDGKKFHIPLYWRFTFVCPLLTAKAKNNNNNLSNDHQSLMTASSQVSSMIAAPLLLSETNHQYQSSPSFTKLVQLFDDFLGSYHIFQQNDDENDVGKGQVYFATKKNAKRSAAFGMLYQLFGKDGIPDDLLGKKKKKKKRTNGLTTLLLTNHHSSQTNDDQKDMANSSASALASPVSHPPPPSVKTLKKLQRKRDSTISSWVEELLSVGVTCVSIEYCQATTVTMNSNLPLTFTNSIVSPWNEGEKGNHQEHLLQQPTLIQCEMEIMEHPMSLRIMGAAYPNKDLALADTVSKVLKAIQSNPNISSTTLPLCINSSEELYLRAKYQLLHANAPSCNYFYFVPHWAHEKIWEQQQQSSMQFLFFEVVLTTNCHVQTSNHDEDDDDDDDDDRHHNPLLICERLGFSNKTKATRVGLILPSCPELEQNIPTIVTATFSLQSSSQQKGDEGIAKLIAKGTIDLDNTKKHLLQQFVKICNNWKHYGMRSQLDSNLEKLLSRHYSFVPLDLEERSDDDSDELEETEHVNVDWNLIEAVVSNRNHPYLAVGLRRYDLAIQQARAPWFLGGLVAISAIQTRRGAFAIVHNQQWQQQDVLDIGAFAIGSISLFCFHLYHFPDCSYDTPTNQFLVHQTRKNALYLAPLKSSSKDGSTFVNSLSLMKVHNNHPPQHKSQTMQAGSTNNNTTATGEPQVARYISYCDYMLERYEILLQHKTLPLIPAVPVTKMVDFRVDEKKAIHLIPELTSILPMPRDFLYTVGYAESFMPFLERAVQLQNHAAILKKLAPSQLSSSPLEDLTSSASMVLDTRSARQQNSGTNNISLVKLLEIATSLLPTKRYERLEFLGDKVLGYFVVWNLFAKNSSLNWDEEDLGNHISAAVRNVALFEGALSAGINQMLYAGLIPWKQKNAIMSDAADGPHVAKISIADSTMADVVESVLAAVYLEEWNNCNHHHIGHMVIPFLNKLNLPMPPNNTDTQNSPKSWFQSPSVCMTNGYPFHIDPCWSKQMNELETILKGEPDLEARLKRNAVKLVYILVGNHGEKWKDKLLNTRGLMLLMLSLFDANLDSTDDTTIVRVEAMDELRRLGIMRDMMFHVGNATLELFVSQDLCFMYDKGGTPGDLHLVKTCCVADDVLVYILMKWNIQECMFDQQASYLLELDRIISKADKLGNQVWTERGGWILSGGNEAYISRRDAFFGTGRSTTSICADRGCTPMYPGLMGGRLCGQTSKLDSALTTDLHFSFKCIMGALVLSIGAEASWYQFFRPLFLEEVMLLTPGEYREHFQQVSSICRSYTKGSSNFLKA